MAHRPGEMREARVSPLLVVGRILAVTGMGMTLASAIFFLVGGFWLAGLIAGVLFLPFFALLFLVERLA